MEADRQYTTACQQRAARGQGSLHVVCWRSKPLDPLLTRQPADQCAALLLLRHINPQTRQFKVFKLKPHDPVTVKTLIKQIHAIICGCFKGVILCKNPFFLFLGAFIRVSEVTSRCKTQPTTLVPKSTQAPPTHIHPAGRMKPASGGNVLLSAALRRMNLPFSSSLRGYKSPVDKLYLRLMFQQS